MKIRTIHHQACTGGTLIAKCIAALDSVCLLSEINPMGTVRLRFHPTELVSQFIAQYSDLDPSLRSKHFHAQLEMIVEICKSNRKALVIRDHSHSDTFRKKPRACSLLRHLADCEVQSLVTIRDPLDCYLGALERGWLKSIDDDFDRYCERLLLFMGENGKIPVVKYEDFCDNPGKSMKRICSILSLEYDESFIDTFPTITLTGDSGRCSGTIETRPHRSIPDEVRFQIEKSESYREFCHEYGYPTVTRPR